VEWNGNSVLAPQQEINSDQAKYIYRSSEDWRREWLGEQKKKEEQWTEDKLI